MQIDEIVKRVTGCTIEVHHGFRSLRACLRSPLISSPRRTPGSRIPLKIWIPGFRRNDERRSVRTFGTRSNSFVLFVHFVVREENE